MDLFTSWNTSFYIALDSRRRTYPESPSCVPPCDEGSGTGIFDGPATNPVCLALLDWDATPALSDLSCQEWTLPSLEEVLGLSTLPDMFASQSAPASPSAPASASAPTMRSPSPNANAEQEDRRPARKCRKRKRLPSDTMETSPLLTRQRSLRARPSSKPNPPAVTKPATTPCTRKYVSGANFCRVKGCTRYFPLTKDCTRHRDTHFPRRFRCPNPDCKSGVLSRYDALARHWASQCTEWSLPREEAKAQASEEFWTEDSLDMYDPKIHKKK